MPSRTTAKQSQSTNRRPLRIVLKVHPDGPDGGREVLAMSVLSQDGSGKWRRRKAPPFPPPGYRYLEGVPALDPDPRQASLVKEAFALALTGRHSLPWLAWKMMLRGLEAADGSPVGPEDLARILSDRSYLGQERLGREWKDAGHEALVAPELFEAVQRRLAGQSVGDVPPLRKQGL